MATRLSDAQRHTLTIITAGGCTAVDQVYGTIGANARTEYRDAKGNRLDGRTVGSLVRRGLVSRTHSRESGAFRIEALTVPASDAPTPAAPVAYPLVDRSAEAPACASAVRIGDHVRLGDGTTGTVTYVERQDLPWWMGEKVTFCFAKDNGGSDAVTLSAEDRLIIIFAAPLRTRRVAA